MELYSKYSVFSNLPTGLFQKQKILPRKGRGFVSERSLKKKKCLFRVKI